MSASSFLYVQNLKYERVQHCHETLSQINLSIFSIEQSWNREDQQIRRISFMMLRKWHRCVSVLFPFIDDRHRVATSISPDYDLRWWQPIRGTSPSKLPRSSGALSTSTVRLDGLGLYTCYMLLRFWPWYLVRRRSGGIDTFPPRLTRDIFGFLRMSSTPK